MRSATIAIAGFLVLGVVVLALWPDAVTPFDPSPPGQYPLGEPRPEWPASQRVRAYQPAADTGTNAVRFTEIDTKTVCATSKTCP
jgi:hypothetical protein